MEILALILFVIVMIFGITIFQGSPYVPSHKKYLRIAFKKLYPLSKDDLLIDIGSGDGVILREAAKFGARSLGYEINPILVFVSKILSAKYKNAKTIFSDFWFVKFPDEVTIVYVFSVSRDIKKIYKKVQSESNRLNKQIYIMSFGAKFDFIKPVKFHNPYSLYLIEPKKNNL